MEVLAKRLKWLRENHRYSQKEIADKIGMSLNGYQKQESDSRDPKLDVLIKFADIYDETTDFLLGRIDTTKLLTQMKQSLITEKEDIAIQNDLFRDNMLSDVPEEVFAKMKHKHSTARNYYKKRLLKYMKEFLKIPFSKPEEDDLLRELCPVDFNINTIDEDGSMIIGIKCANGMEFDEFERVYIPNNIDEQVELLEDLLEFYGEKLNRVEN